LATASRAMRQILVDHARGRGRRKRTPPGERMSLEHAAWAYEENTVDLVALHEALERLAVDNPTMARAVDLVLFAGTTLEETARLLEIPQRTFERRWKTTRAWLHAELA